MFPHLKVFKKSCKVSVHGFVHSVQLAGSLLETARIADAYYRAAQKYWDDLGLFQKTLVYMQVYSCVLYIYI